MLEQRIKIGHGKPLIHALKEYNILFKNKFYICFDNSTVDGHVNLDIMGDSKHVYELHIKLKFDNGNLS
jgi:hypothetical protein